MQDSSSRKELEAPPRTGRDFHIIGPVLSKDSCLPIPNPSPIVLPSCVSEKLLTDSWPCIYILSYKKHDVWKLKRKVSQPGGGVGKKKIRDHFLNSEGVDYFERLPVAPEKLIKA